MYDFFRPFHFIEKTWLTVLYLLYYIIIRIMRLTSQVITDAPIVVNPARQVTIQLRRLKIPYIENLGITKDAFEVIDLTDNELIEISNFPLLKNLKVLLMANNNITGISDEKLPNNLPHLQTISLINNNISQFLDIKILSHVRRLTDLALIGNPIRDQTNYRYFMIWLIPSLKVLDFSKIKQKEVLKARELFGESLDNPNELASSFLAELLDGEEAKEVVPKDDRNLQAVGKKLTDEDKTKLLLELESASSIEDIERIETVLRSGYM